MPDWDIPKPNTFIAGAPKCGTTSLAHWLSEHPDIFVPSKKEPHFFNPPFSRNLQKEEYLKLYQRAVDFKIRIDASTSYFTSEKAIENIIKFNPNAKFVILLRNPVEVAEALHGECLYRGLEDLKNFEQAWRVQECRRIGKKLPIGAWFASAENLLYRDQVLFGQSLQHLLYQTNEDQVHVVFSEDMQKNPAKEYREVIDFLGLFDDGRNDFPSLNRSKRNRHAKLTRYMRFIANVRMRLGLPGLGVMKKIQSLGHRNEAREKVHEAVQMSIFNELKSDIELLGMLTARDLRHWNPNCQIRHANPADLLP